MLHFKLSDFMSKERYLELLLYKVTIRILPYVIVSKVYEKYITPFISKGLIVLYKLKFYEQYIRITSSREKYIHPSAIMQQLLNNVE